MAQDVSIWKSRVVIAKRERQRKANAKHNSETGDCIRWITRGQCSLADSCAFNHDPNKKGKGKGRPRSLSPTGSPHRNSKGDGEGSDDAGAHGTPKFTDKSPSGKANRPFCTNFKKGSCHRRNSRDYWHVPDCTKFHTPSRCRFGDKTYCRTCWCKDNFSNDCFSHSFEWKTGQIRKNAVGWQKTRYRVRLYHLPNKYVLKNGNSGSALGVIQTRPQN